MEREELDPADKMVSWKIPLMRGESADFMKNIYDKQPRGEKRKFTPEFGIVDEEEREWDETKDEGKKSVEIGNNKVGNEWIDKEK